MVETVAMLSAAAKGRLKVATKAEAAMAVVAIGALDARRKREVGAERQREEAATRAVEWMAAMAVTEARATRRRGRGRRQRLQCPPVPRGPRRSPPVPRPTPLALGGHSDTDLFQGHKCDVGNDLTPLPPTHAGGKVT